MSVLRLPGSFWAIDIKKHPKTKRVQNVLVYIYFKWLWANSSAFAGGRGFSSEEKNFKDSIFLKKKKERIKEWKDCNYFVDFHHFPGSSGVHITKGLSGSEENWRLSSAGSLKRECGVETLAIRSGLQCQCCANTQVHLMATSLPLESTCHS